MPRLTNLLGLMAALAIAAPAAAQQATTDSALTTAPATDSAQTDAPGAGVLLNTGEPAEPRVGEPYVAGIEGDWQIRCMKTADGNDPCQMYQLLLDAQGNSVAEMTLFDLPPGQEAAMGGTIIAPLATLLPAQLTVQIDDNPARRYPFTFCEQQGCIASVGYTAAEVDQMRRGIKGTVSLVPARAPDTTVALAVSLIGFTAASEAIAINE